MLEDRREYPVIDVVDGLAALAQPDLLSTEHQRAAVVNTRSAVADIQVETVLVPEARSTT